MKYIRTKDGIYEIDETTILTSLPPCYKVIKPADKHYSINEQQVIKSADTLEKLCDCFVGIRKSDHKPYLGKKSGNYWFEELGGWLGRIDSYENIYGAIWTDKGLIYVAKMNDEGVLELI